MRCPLERWQMPYFFVCYVLQLELQELNISIQKIYYIIKLQFEFKPFRSYPPFSIKQYKLSKINMPPPLIMHSGRKISKTFDFRLKQSNLFNHYYLFSQIQHTSIQFSDPGGLWAFYKDLPLQVQVLWNEIDACLKRLAPQSFFIKKGQKKDKKIKFVQQGSSIEHYSSKYISFFQIYPKGPIFLGQIALRKMHYNNIKIRIRKEKSKKNGTIYVIQFYYTPSTILDQNSNLAYYFIPNAYQSSVPTYDQFSLPQPSYIQQTYSPLFSEQVQTISIIEPKNSLMTLKTEISETIEGPSESRTNEKVLSQVIRPTYRKCQKLGIQEIKLKFRIEWKNENRNIVPNLVNQMMSFLLKKNKSQRLIRRLFDFYPHSLACTTNKFYLYMRKIKDSISHYVNESVIQYFFQVHEPKCEIYLEEEQEFYMKLCRIAIVTFLSNDAIIISLLSTRMSQAKRKTHLIARDALLRKFLELARNRPH